MSTPAGWYDDGSGRHRWWDGNQWTEHFAPAQPPAPEPSAPLRPASGPDDTTPSGGVAQKRKAPIVGIIVSVAGGVIAVAIALAVWFSGASLGEAPVTQSTTPPAAGPTDSLPTVDDEFSLGNGFSVSLTIGAETLDTPEGLNGEAPTEEEIAREWGPAVVTNGEVAVVTATIRNEGDAADGTVAVVSAMTPSLEKYDTFIQSTHPEFDLSILNLEVAPGTTQTFRFAYVMPASDLDTAVVEVLLHTDMGEGQRFAAFQPNPGEACEELAQTDLPEVAFWSCLRVTE